MEVDDSDVSGVASSVSAVSLADVPKSDSAVSIRTSMLDRVANSDAHFKHQQRGEPDLTVDQKRAIAEQILDKNPVTFLARFGRYLVEEDLEYFKDQTSNYEVSFYVSDIRRFLDDRKNEQKKRNRRFEAMKVMMGEGEYFSSESMKERDPLLYEQLIGQYMTSEEIEEEVKGRDLNLSSVLMEHVQSMANSELYSRLCDIEEGQMEEDEDDDDEIQDGRLKKEVEEEEDDGEQAQAGEDGVEISASEKQMLKNEFLRTMQLRFLNGEDRQFDYRSVDENVEYDSLDIREHDEEEKYFDQSDSDNYTPASESCGEMNYSDPDYDDYQVGDNIRNSDKSDGNTDKSAGNIVEEESDVDYEDYEVGDNIRNSGKNDSNKDNAIEKCIVEEESDNEVGDNTRNSGNSDKNTDNASGNDKTGAGSEEFWVNGDNSRDNAGSQDIVRKKWGEIT